MCKLLWLQPGFDSHCVSFVVIYNHDGKPNEKYLCRFIIPVGHVCQKVLLARCYPFINFCYYFCFLHPQINGNSVVGRSHQNASAIIKSISGNKVSLVIHRHPDNFDHLAVKPITPPPPAAAMLDKEKSASIEEIQVCTIDRYVIEIHGGCHFVPRLRLVSPSIQPPSWK